MSLLSRIVDERFLTHRRQSTSVAGMITSSVATILFAYRYFSEHVWSWDLLAVSLTFVGIKLALMAWYLITN
jgi:hypothetical protein